MFMKMVLMNESDLQEGGIAKDKRALPTSVPKQNIFPL